MPLITLTTEWKSDDIYSGIIKGKLSSLCPGVVIIENASGIAAFDILHAAFVVRNTYLNYPAGSVHIIFVHSEAAKKQNHLIVRANDHFFIGTDNGIFSLVLNGEPDEIIKIDHDGDSDELDTFARTAASLLSGKSPSELGKPAGELVERVPHRATIESNTITGSIIFIDSYGNAISNITREVFLRIFEKDDYRILIQSNKNCTEQIVRKYSDVAVGDLLTRFNSLDLLEIAINGANISELLNLGTGTVVRIEKAKKTKSPGHLF